MAISWQLLSEPNCSSELAALHVRFEGAATTVCLGTERGRAFIRNVCMAFDARLTRKAPETQLFSRTV
jgi:hypothetical protein